MEQLKSLENTNVKRFLTVYVVYYFVCNVPPHTVGLVLTFLRYNSCESASGVDTTVSLVHPEVSWLILYQLALWNVITCIVNLAMGLLLLPIIVLAFKAGCKRSYIPIWLIFFLNGCFSVAWFIYGGVILFTEPGDNCKNAPDGLMVWEVGVSLWVLTIIISTGQHCVRKIASLRQGVKQSANKKQHSHSSEGPSHSSED